MIPEPEIVLQHKETYLFSWDFTSSTSFLGERWDVGSAPVSPELSIPNRIDRFFLGHFHT